MVNPPPKKTNNKMSKATSRLRLAIFRRVKTKKDDDDDRTTVIISHITQFDVIPVLRIAFGKGPPHPCKRSRAAPSQIAYGHYNKPVRIYKRATFADVFCHIIRFGDSNPLQQGNEISMKAWEELSRLITEWTLPNSVKALNRNVLHPPRSRLLKRKQTAFNRIIYGLL